MTLKRSSSDPSSANQNLRQFVPPSLLRVRAFLFAQGMPIVPWATAAEVLDEFHELLCSQQTNDAFWLSLRALLVDLNIDLQELLPGDANNNEVTSLANREALLDEIRQCIGVGQSPNNGFVALARKLSQSCLAVMLLLGAAATVSCGAQADDGASSNTGGSGNADGGSSATSTGGTSQHVGGGSSFVISTGGSTANLAGTTPCVNTTPGTGNASPSSMNDVRSIANQCIPAGATRDSVLACLETLNTSWQQGLAALLNCTTCGQAAQYLNTLASSCSNLPAAYEGCLVAACVAIYNGVRMD